MGDILLGLGQDKIVFCHGIVMGKGSGLGQK